jgi:putative hydrolase of the HAD superfamily
MGSSDCNRRPVVLFDLFGVIARHQPEHSKQKLEELAGVDPAVFWEAYWKQRVAYDRGIRAPEYWQSVGSVVGREFDASEVAALTVADVESWSSVDQEMIAYLRVLSEKYCLAMLSNITHEIADFYERNHVWLRLFSMIGFSCRIKAAKPESKAYLWCCEKLDCSPRDVYFIDDREPNVAAATLLGMKGHVFTDIDGLREFLNGRRGPRQFRL